MPKINGKHSAVWEDQYIMDAAIIENGGFIYVVYLMLYLYMLCMQTYHIANYNIFLLWL